MAEADAKDTEVEAGAPQEIIKPRVKCFLCKCETFLPVRWTYWRYNRKDKLKSKYCLSSMNSLCCLTCMIEYCSSYSYEAGLFIKCPFGCCEGQIPDKPYLMYGDVCRSAEDNAEKFLWDVLDACGAFNKRCNLCEYTSKTMEEAIEHPSNCPKKKISLHMDILDKKEIVPEFLCEGLECAICLCPAFLPVRLNNLTVIFNEISDKQELKVEHCPVSSRSPCCLTCVREFYHKKNGDEKIIDFKYVKCVWGCCNGFMPPKPHLIYGEHNRKPEDYAENCLWKILNTYGVFNKQCNCCYHMCASMEEARDHPRKACPKRKIPCSGCRKLVMFEEIETHRLECLFASFRLL